MADTIRLEVVTPDATVYSEDVDMVTLPGVEGQMGVQPQHVRLMTQLVPGELIVHKGGHDKSMAVGEGLVEITNERVSIVTNMAIAIDKIDEAAAERAVCDRSQRLEELWKPRSLLQMHEPPVVFSQVPRTGYLSRSFAR